MKLSASPSLPSIIVNTTTATNVKQQPHHIIAAVLDTSPIQCTQFYYFDEGGTTTAAAAPTTSTTTAKANVVLRSSSSNTLTRHLEMHDERRQRETMVRRSSTGLFSSLSLSTSTSTVSTASTASSSSASSDEDEEQVNDDEREQKKSILSAATATQYPSIKLTQRLPHTSGCLDVNMAERLRSHFPSRVAVCSEWSLLYSMDQHGASLQTMYRQLSQHHGPCVLVIQTIDDEIFGAYLSEPVHVQSRYYGSGECFLWRLDSSSSSTNNGMHVADQDIDVLSTAAAAAAAANTESSVLPLDIYRWTGKNDYLCYSARDYISMGGGDGRVAIWLDEDLLQGHTESCATFDNKPLATSSKFECLALEVWGFRY